MTTSRVFTVLLLFTVLLVVNLSSFLFFSLSEAFQLYSSLAFSAVLVLRQNRHCFVMLIHIVLSLPSRKVLFKSIPYFFPSFPNYNEFNLRPCCLLFLHFSPPTPKALYGRSAKSWGAMILSNIQSFDKRLVWKPLSAECFTNASTMCLFLLPKVTSLRPKFSRRRYRQTCLERRLQVT